MEATLPPGTARGRDEGESQDPPSGHRDPTKAGHLHRSFPQQGDCLPHGLERQPDPGIIGEPATEAGPAHGQGQTHRVALPNTRHLAHAMRPCLV